LFKQQGAGIMATIEEMKKRGNGKQATDFSLEEIAQYAEALKIVIEAFEGKKDIRSRVAVLASPDNLKSMSILTKGETKFCVISHFLGEHEEYDGLFECLTVRAEEMKSHSPSTEGKGREQVIAFVGAIETLKKLRVMIKGDEGEKGGESD